MGTQYATRDQLRPLAVMDGTSIGGKYARPVRDRCIALSDLKITKADGTVTYVSRTRKPNRVRVVSDRERTLALIRSLDTIHDPNLL